MDPITTQPAPSDAQVLAAAAATIATPRVEEGDSFILHAPLEVLARSSLLTLADPEAREEIRGVVHGVANTYRDWGTAVPRPVQRIDTSSDEATKALAAAVADGDLDAVDDTVAWLAANVESDDLVAALAPLALRSLAAAAHGPILLHLLPRAAPRSLDAASMARTTLHELARHPDWVLRWTDTIEPGRPTSTLVDCDHQNSLGNELASRLRSPQLDDRPPNTFIYPTMAAVDRSGLAHDLLARLVPELTLETARRQLLRMAAQSMLQDTPDHAPYGWSHCLTMPQAALSIARTSGNPTVAIAVAGTYVLGFRATLGSADVDPHFVPEPSSTALAELTQTPPSDAAALAWHAPADRHAQVWRTLATNAATHPDAHLAKYTLACVDAARSDPDRHDLYRAAAAYLNAWWHEHDQG